MKKQLLLGSALIAAISAFSQSARPIAKSSGMLDRKQELAARYAMEMSEPAQNPTISNPSLPIGPEENTQASKETANSISWALIAGSMNCYGQLVSSTRPLQYNAALNAVSLIHRKSTSYTPFPAANSNAGTIVAEITTNWGVTWDSTCIWSDAGNGGRYPQGAIYNPPGNTNMNSAHVVGCGPVVNASAFTGNWFASKQLGAPGSAAYNTTASAVPGGQQFFPFSYTNTTTPFFMPFGWARYGFASTNDGKVRSLALIQDDNSTLGAIRGYMLVKGAFSAGAMVWSTDSIIPPTVTAPSDGSKWLDYEPQMVWNESGTVGYIVTTGGLSIASGNNRGASQPIVYKTTNSGQSWNLCVGINFNSPTMKLVTDYINPITHANNATIPYTYEFDCAVDANDNLHIGATFFSSASADDDSLNYYQTFTTSINPTEQYRWTHTAGLRPYVYDFVGNGTNPWQVALIDSMSSEGPGVSSGRPGFNSNPWDVQTTKVNVDSRLHMGRTPDGKIITISWSETDSAFIAGSKKWNSAPNIKVRAIAVIGTATAPAAYSVNCIVSPDEHNITKPANGPAGAKVINKAFLQYMSPTVGSPTVVNNPTTALKPIDFVVDYNVPFTITSNAGLTQLDNMSIYYTSAKLSFAFLRILTTATDVAVSENASNSVNESFVFPNPAAGNANLRISLKDNSKVEISVMSILGNVVKAGVANGVIGENNIDLDLTGLSTGIYMVNVKVGNSNATHKLVVQ